MPDPYRTGAYIKIDDSGAHAELRVVIADREVQGQIDADMLEAFVRLLSSASADMQRIRSGELKPPVKPQQFFVTTKAD